MIGELLRNFMIRRHDAKMKIKREHNIFNQKMQEQRKITRAILLAGEQERSNIGRELHDNVNQILASVKLFLSVAGEKASGSNTDYLHNATKLLNEAIEEIRKISQHQVTPLKKVDLKEIIQLLIDGLTYTTDVKTWFFYNADHDILDDDLKLNIYRIV
jgi:signal transduction histidine kinase